MVALPDEIVQQIAEGSGRCYAYEGKLMALELIEWRRKAKEAAAPLTLAPGQGGHPYP